MPLHDPPGYTRLNKEVLNLKKTIRKVFTGVEIKVVDAEQMIIDHCISDDQPDRVNDDIALDAWEKDNFMMNPVVLDIHDYSAPPVAKCLKLYESGNQLRAETQFAPTERGKMYFDLYSGGFMRAFSVGFIGKGYDSKKEGGFHFKQVELLEYSVVPVPCNPRALKGVAKYGVPISKANLEKLISVKESMVAAVDLLEEVIAEAERDDEENPETPDTPETTPPEGGDGDTGKIYGDVRDLLKGMASK